MFDKVADEFIGSDGDYHLIINDRYQRYKKGVPDVNEFLYEYYWNIKPNHKNVICNQATYALLTPTEKERVVFIQTNSKKRVIIKKEISIFAAPSNVRGKDLILRYDTFMRKAKIPQKYFDKLRAKYRNFQMTEFSEYRFE